MASAAASGPARFVASERLARLALQTLERQEKLQAGETVRAWVSYLPQAIFLDDTELLAPGQERLEATPEGLPGLDEKDVVARTQEAIGTRVERLLSNLAFEAAARKEKVAPVSDGTSFAPHVHQALLKSLPIPRPEAEAVLECLMSDLRVAAQNQTLTGDWGALCEGPKGLYLDIAAPLERLPADRARARIVGGLARDRRV